MSLLKYIERVKRMDDLIRRKATGTPEEFAKSLQVGKTILMEDLRELKLLGAEFHYCKVRQSYCYDNEFVLKIGCLNKAEQKNVKGGQNYFQDSDPVRYYRTGVTYFSSAEMLVATSSEP